MDNTTSNLGFLEFFILISLVFLGIAVQAHAPGNASQPDAPANGSALTNEEAKVSNPSREGVDPPGDDPNPSDLSGKEPEPTGSNGGDSISGNEMDTNRDPREGPRSRDRKQTGFDKYVEEPGGSDGGNSVKGTTDPPSKPSEGLRNPKDLQAKIDELTAQVRRLLATIADLEQLLQAARARIKELERELRITRSSGPRIDPAIIGLRGSFKRVVILVDASYSMGGATGTAGERPWTTTREGISTWLRLLELEECALVVFNDGVRRFPDRGMVPIKEDHANRDRLTVFLGSNRPQGETNTLAALKAGYEYGPDTIVLFTDGRPELAGHESEKMMDDIYRLCDRHRDVPINCVGLGNYFDPQFSGFLLRIAKITGGTFVGR